MILTNLMLLVVLTIYINPFSTSSLDIKPELTDLQSDHETLKKKSQIDSSGVGEEVWLKYTNTGGLRHNM